METIINGIKKVVRTTAMIALFIAWSVALVSAGYFKGQNSVYELTMGKTNDAIKNLASLVTPAEAATPTAKVKK